MLQIKVLGPGCRNCKKLEDVTNKAVATLGIEAKVEKVSDYVDIMQYNIISTPGLVINERVASAGRIPSEGEITTWLADAMAGEPA